MRRLPAIPVLIVLACALACACVARLSMGHLPTRAEDPTTRDFLLHLRLDRAVIAAIVGGGLALAGVLLQSLLRNPLASPDLLALAPGAGLGVMAAIFITSLRAGLFAEPGPLGASGAAMLGAFAALTIVYLASQRRGWVHPTTLILVGVIVGLICGAGVMLLQHLMPDQGYQASRLLIGTIREETPRAQVWGAGVAVLACACVSAALGPWMDASSLSDDEARSVGVPLRALRIMQFSCAGILTAAAVVLAGPIGFVGLVCPHIVRRVLGPSHRPLIIGAVLLGAAALVLADTAVEAIKLANEHAGGRQYGRLPLGVVTALLGGPVFVWMLRSSKGTQ